MATTPSAPQRQDILYSPGLRKLTALSGLAFAVLMIAAIFTSGEGTPDWDAPLTEWTTYADDSRDNLRISTLLFALAAYQFVLFLATLRSYLGAAEQNASPSLTSGRYIILIGGIMGIVGMTIGIALNMASTAREGVSPEVVRGINDAASAGFLLSSPGFATMMIAVFIVSKATKALPAWLTWVALVSGVSFLLQIFTLLSDEHDNAFGLFYPLGFLTLAIFAIGSSIFGYRIVSREGSGTAAT